MLADAMLVAMAKHYNIWAVHRDQLLTCCYGFGWHAANVQQKHFPSSQDKHS